MKKEDFLNKLRKNTHVQFDMPAVDVKGIQYEDTLKQFIEMTESVGGHVIEAKEGESLDELVKKAYPEAKVFASHLPEITIAQKNPDTVAEANDLNGTDVGIVRGEVGVAENGCVWILLRDGNLRQVGSKDLRLRISLLHQLIQALAR